MIGVEDDSVIIATCNSEMCMGGGGEYSCKRLSGVWRRAEMDKEHIKYQCLKAVM